MIHLTEIKPDLIKMEIKMHLPQMDVINFLQKKGYEVKAFFFVVPASEEFLISEPAFSVSSFTATKDGELQSEETMYLNVFEKEIKSFLSLTK
ncbi:hypothetical protein SAMN05660477_00399 [Soonwooa buanensis]|uniref:Uncharacterized protein n=1 Tax=Soonwooa buanensis TaxID=619805 RepID=A0A1T5CW35_9FLAO|nr:hypothetical protein [Soonwooa buanensis]SKB63563.1 hypothetical protein SAMN05660477_00399 [Soonwooa buanensis]